MTAYHIQNLESMSKRSIRKVVARARREAYQALKYYIKSLMWVEQVTIDDHLSIFVDVYKDYFWSHLASACQTLRPLAEGEKCATAKEISIRMIRSLYPFGGYMRVSLTHSTFYLKEFDDQLSCGPHFPGDTVLNATTDDISELIVAYDNETQRCHSVVQAAINECNAEAVALEMVLASARSLAENVIMREGIALEADQVGTTRAHYIITLKHNPLIEVSFWATIEEFRPRLSNAIRSLHHRESRT